jgi:multisubunit Na+/H+ antiporter MnhG subunit
MPRNVGDAEAAIRLAISVFTIVVSGALILAEPGLWMAFLALGASVGALLLARSAVSRHCPVHDTMEVDTTRRSKS